MLPDEPIREHPDLPGDSHMGTDGGGDLPHDGVGSVADGVGRVGGQDDVNGGSPHIGMDGGGDPQMVADGGDGRRQQCKNLVAAPRNRRQKLNSTKVILLNGTWY
jgi:hypothetical protein